MSGKGKEDLGPNEHFKNPVFKDRRTTEDLEAASMLDVQFLVEPRDANMVDWDIETESEVRVLRATPSISQSTLL